MDVTWGLVQAMWGMVLHFPLHVAQLILNSGRSHIGMDIVMQHDNTFCEHGGILSLDGNLNVSRGFHSRTVPFW